METAKREQKIMILSSSNPQNLVTKLDYGGRIGLRWSPLRYANMSSDRRGKAKNIQNNHQTRGKDKK